MDRFWVECPYCFQKMDLKLQDIPDLDDHVAAKTAEVAREAARDGYDEGYDDGVAHRRDEDTADAPAAAFWRALAAAWAGRAEMRARLAEDLLARRERRASDAVARGNRTRAERGAAMQRERVRQTTAELRAAIAARGPVQDGLGIE